MTQQGRKFDDDKLRYDLIPVLAQEEVVRVVTLGAKKYDPENWKRVPEGRRRYYAAAMRHIEAWRKGEKQDEIGTHHIANAISNLMFILEKELQGIEDVPSEESGQEPVPTERLIQDDGWIPWTGGECPVNPDTKVVVKFRGEHEAYSYAKYANYWAWSWCTGESAAEIVAYKIVKD